MLRYLVFFVVFFISIKVSSQTVITRTNGTNTIVDPRFMSTKNLIPPRYADTTAANLDLGVDSCGALIFTYNTNNYWLRACNPKRWSNVGGGSGTVTSLAATDGNGFDLSIASPTTTPNISLTTTLSNTSIPYIGASGALTQDNVNLNYDDINKRLVVQQVISPATNPLNALALRAPAGQSIFSIIGSTVYHNVKSDGTIDMVGTGLVSPVLGTTTVNIGGTTQAKGSFIITDVGAGVGEFTVSGTDASLGTRTNGGLEFKTNNLRRAFISSIGGITFNTSTNSYTFPTNRGAAGTVLTDVAGNGTLSWTLPPSSITMEQVRDEISDSLSITDSLVTGPSFEVVHISDTKDSLYLKGDNDLPETNVFWGKNSDGIRGFYQLPVTSVAGKNGGEITLDAADIISGRFSLDRIPLVTGITGSYTSANITVDEYGRIVGASNGSGGGGGGAQNPDSATTNIMWATDSAYSITNSTSPVSISDTFTINANYFRRADKLPFSIIGTFMQADADTVDSNTDNIHLNIAGNRITIFNKPDDRKLSGLRMDIELYRFRDSLYSFVKGAGQYTTTGDPVVKGFLNVDTKVVGAPDFGQPMPVFVEYSQGTVNQNRDLVLRRFDAARGRYDERAPLGDYVPPPPTPTLNVTPTSLTLAANNAGTASASQSFNVSGDDLTANVSIIPPSAFEISTDNVSFSGSINLTQSGGNIVGEPVAIHVRTKASEPVGTPSGNVVSSSTGATPKNVAVSGTVNTPPSATTVAQFNFSLTTTSGASGAVADWVDCLGLPGGTASGHTAAVRSASDSRSGSAITVSTIATANWAGISQASNTCASDVWGPTSCTGSCYFGNVALTRGGYGVEGTTSHSAGNEHFEFGGLNPAKHYKFEIIGSRTTGIASRRVLYTLVHDAGTSTATVDVKDNTANHADFTGILPRPDGTIRLHMRRDPTDANNTFAAYCSALRIIQED